MPGDCPRKAVTVKMFEMEDMEHFEDNVIDDEMNIGKIMATDDTSINQHKFQILKTDLSSNIPPCINSSFSSYQDMLVENVEEYTPAVYDTNVDVTFSDPEMDSSLRKLLSAKVNKLEERKEIIMV